ncbi:cytochrome P450 [Aspergillus brunneoviolaceus CBS 621.78]|uniref:Benzoate 4-monooxygenase cytochrome P450 n=1 Tax=Aspergillus brunneoviolaceus CBS 621.78 TaxID=1450534 RepID=A0ACD1GFH9_9EURO|nr:benzoate 4-monooxygenase cytochrome P450 [Aspergillus brunneoviolaceus CBS 621.78]RAH47920.1 benzoate 4-monooxygenase cytochrome P450 [Aspergillus brunneoviolaceus CBS 621.78]
MWTLTLTTVFLFVVTKYLYRLYFHPLRSVPGPKLAAMTHLHEFYYDVVRGGKFIWEVKRMHEKYGPIVRINPREVHIVDFAFYDEIYAGAGRRRDKDPQMVAFLASPHAALATVDHDLHRSRRNQLNPFFSKKSVGALMPVIYEKVDLLCEHLTMAAKEMTVINLSDAFVALTGDIITHYLYGQDTGCLASKHFANNGIWHAVAEITDTCHLFQFWPLLPRILKALPGRWIRSVKPKLAAVYEMQDRIARQSEECLQSNSRERLRTIYGCLTDPAVPVAERSLARLRDESFILLIGGTETTAATLTFAMYHLLRDKERFFRLREEVETIVSRSDGRVPWPQVERLPYLAAVVNESLRLGAVAMRPSRVAPHETLHYNGCAIPPGTPMSTSSYFLHRNPEIFPNPESFDPERWITASERGANLSKYLVPFTRGTRACVGINLSYAEIYTTLATIVCRFDLELCDTPPERMAFTREMIVQRPEEGVWTLKARVVGAREDRS